MIPVTSHTFTPKEVPNTFGSSPNAKWRVSLERVGAESGYDYNLLIENPQTEVGYLLEFGIDRDGKLIAQLTPNAGGDAVVIIYADQEQVRCSANGCCGTSVFDQNGVHQED